MNRIKMISSALALFMCLFLSQAVYAQAPAPSKGKPAVEKGKEAAKTDAARKSKDDADAYRIKDDHLPVQYKEKGADDTLSKEGKMSEGNKEKPEKGKAYGKDKGDLEGKEFGRNRADEASGNAKKNKKEKASKKAKSKQ
ncbi:MAG: hypothetical protein KF852_17620 [Saprospiraceae bacterium]|nr:hypothetical protein [Saprospiraceae bacterium]